MVISVLVAKGLISRFATASPTEKREMIYFIAWISPSPLEVPLQKSEFVDQPFETRKSSHLTG